MDNEKHIYVYNFVTRELEYDMDMKVDLASVSVSLDSKLLLVNRMDGEARILGIESRETIRVFRSGDRGGKFIIRSAFGGANESFVITGSIGEFNHCLSGFESC